MKSYYVFHSQTGEILRQGFCSDKDFEHQALAGQIVAEGKIKNETHVVDGNPVYIPPPPPTPEEIVAQEEAKHELDLRKNLSAIVFDFENRLRALEKQPAMTKKAFRQQFKTS